MRRRRERNGEETGIRGHVLMDEVAILSVEGRLGVGMDTMAETNGLGTRVDGKTARSIAAPGRMGGVDLLILCWVCAPLRT